MPNNTRGEAKRKIEYSVGNIQNAIEKLVWIGETYKQHHPEISVGVGTAIEALQFVQEFLNKLNEAI